MSRTPGLLRRTYTSLRQLYEVTARHIVVHNSSYTRPHFRALVELPTAYIFMLFNAPNDV